MAVTVDNRLKCVRHNISLIASWNSVLSSDSKISSKQPGVVDTTMADEIKQEVIKKTQNSLGKYIKKPPLTEKLLRKPPFRFLHDIISAVIKETKFLEGLFSEDELNSDFKDKESKIAYLTKLINVVRVELTVRPAKIVSGQEPTKTNQLLQAIANALDKNISSTEAVKHYKTTIEKNTGRSTQRSSPKHESRKAADANHSNPGKKVAEQQEKDHKSTKSSARKQTRERHEKVVKNKDSSSVGKSQSRKNLKTVDETPVQSKISSNSPTIGKSGSAKNKPSVAEAKQLLGNNSNDIQSQLRETSESPLPPDIESETAIKQQEDGDDSTKIVPSQETVQQSKEPEVIDKSPETGNSVSALPKEAEILESVAEANKNSFTEPPVSTLKHSLRPPSGRPSSARPAAPKLRWKPEFSIKTSDLEVLENKSVILDSFDAQDDDKDRMVVVETDTHQHSSINGGTENINGDVSQEHGYLVAQILETQRELTNTTNINHLPNKIDMKLDGGSMKNKENTVQEVDKLRGKIQTLTRATNPMGNLLDFWQEDVELMQKELFEWRNQFRQLYNQLKTEQTSSHTWAKEKEESLSEIKAAINDQHDKIYYTQLNITKNNPKIQQLLDGGA